MSLIALDGQLSLPRSYSFDELRAVPDQVIERSMLLGGRAICGVRLSALVAALGRKPWARFAVVSAADGYGINIPVAHAADCLLVYAVGRAALPPELGGPVRLFARGLGRCSNVKNVVRVSFAEAAVDVEHACAHALAHGAGTLLVAPGGHS